MELYTRREWLNTDDAAATAFISASVERDAWCSAGAVKIADCNRIMELSFWLGKRAARTNALNKVARLIAVLTEFQAELIDEAKWQEKKEKKEKKEKREKEQK